MRPPRVTGPRQHPGQPYYRKRRLRRKYRTGEWTDWLAAYDLEVGDEGLWGAWITTAGNGSLETYDLAGGGHGGAFWLTVARLVGGTYGRAREDAQRVAETLRAAPGVRSVTLTGVGDSWRP